MTIKAGAGDDTVTLAAAPANGTGKVVSLDGGADIDTLAVTGNVDLSAVTGTLTITGFEALDIAAGTTLTFSNTQFDAAFGKNDVTVTGHKTGTLAIVAASNDGETINLSSVTTSAVAKDTADVTITGGYGDDIITTNAGYGATVTAGEGDDTITLTSSDYTDTVVFSAFDDNGTDTINGFKVGADGDVLDLDSTNTAANAGYAGNFVGTAKTSGAEQVMVDDTAYVVHLDEAIASVDFTSTDGFAKVFAASGTAISTTVKTTGAKNLVIVQGTDATQLLVTDADDNTTLANTEVTCIGILMGVTAEDAFVDDNIANG